MNSFSMARPAVLVVDDDSINRRVIANVLEGMCEVIQAESGQESLALAQASSRPLLIVLDVVMPDLDGFEVCRRMKADERTQSNPIIFLTALEDAQHEARGLELGAVDFIYKPVNRSIVRSRVGTQLELLQHRSFLEQMLERRDEDLRTTHQRVSDLLRSLRTSERRLRDFMDYAPLAMSIKDLDGRYVVANRVAHEHTGFTESELSGKTNEELGRWPDQPTAPDIRRQEQAVKERQIALTEVREEVNAQGEARIISATKFPIRDAQNEVVGIGTINADITEQRAIEEALRESEARLTAFFDNAPNPYLVKGRDRRYTLVNTAAGAFFGVPPEAFNGKTVEEVLPPALAEPIAASDSLVLEKGEAVDAEGTRLTPQGERIVRTVKFPIRDDSGEVVAAGTILTDETARKAAEKAIERQQAQLRRLASELSLAEERERRRIAAELHDGAVQSLGLLRIKTGLLHGKVHEPAHVESVDELRVMLDGCIHDLRALMSDLSPPMLYELGLGAALEWLAEKLQTDHGITCTCDASGPLPTIGKDVEVLLFQTTRELLRNVVKHAGASSASVKLRVEDTDLILSVADDGRGATEADLGKTPSDSGGFGLFNIQERLRLLDGSLSVRGDEGTEVELRLPVATLPTP